VRTRLGDFVRSERFAGLWDGLSRRTHASAVALLTGSDEARVQIAGDRLVVDLGPLLGPAREAVERAGLTAPVAPAGANPQLVLGDASGIERARGAVELLQKIAWVLPVLGLLCLVHAVFTAPDRRRGILRAGLALVAGMVLLALGAVLAGRAGADLGPVGRFVRDHRRALEGTAALIGGVVLVALSRPTGASMLVVLAVAALVEVVAASARPETP
jgi:hypothetical protein